MKKNRKILRLSISVVPVFLATILLTISAHAASSWNASSGSWNNSANWIPTAVPTSADDVIIKNGGNAIIDAPEACNTISTGYSGTGNGNCTLETAGSLTISGAANIGGWSSGTITNTGYFTQNGGTHTISGGLLIGQGTTIGEYILNGGELYCNNQYVSYSAPGSFTQNDGTNNAVSVYMSNTANKNSEYTLNGGTLINTAIYIGYRGTGTVSQTSGLHTNSNGILIGHLAGAEGTYNLSGGTLKASYIRLGAAGIGTFNQTGGDNFVQKNLSVSYSAGSIGTYNMSGGTLDLASAWTDLYVGRAAGATGTFIQTGGTVTITNASQNLIIGNSGGYGTYELGGSGALKLANREYIYNGTFIQTGGTHIVNDRIVIYTNGCLSGWGTVNVITEFDQDGSVIANGYGSENSLIITNYGKLYFNQINGTEDTNGWYAVNHGKLTLADVTTANVTPYWGNPYWGTMSGKDKVNSFYMHVDTRIDDGRFFASLYAVDNTNVPLFDVTSKITAIWGLDDPIDPVDVQADITFRYDHVAAANLGIAEADLKVYTHVGGVNDEWTQITDFGLDTAANKITASNVTEVIAFFAVGDGIVSPLPPQGTVIIIK